MMGTARMFGFDPFHFEALRALWYAPSGGADPGEVFAIAGRIRDGDIPSWYRGWSEAARSLSGAPHADPFSAGNAQLRASNYMRTAEFFLAPDAVERSESAAFAQSRFYAGLELLGIAHERLSLPYGNARMEALLLPAATRSDLLLVIHGGFDSTPEEMFFTIGREAQARGIDVLIYEAPGQGNLLRKHGLVFDPAWEKPLGTAIDAALERRSYAKIVGLGVSMGGHFLARAAAREKRLDGIILCDYFPAPIEAFKHGLPRFLHRALVERRPWLMKLIEWRTRSDIELNWVVQNGKWVFGANDLSGLIERVLRFDEGPWAGDVEAHVLAMTGAAEHFFDKDLYRDFAARLTRAASVTHVESGVERGGQLHCRNGAYHLLSDIVFDWIAGRFGPAAPAKPKRRAAR